MIPKPQEMERSKINLSPLVGKWFHSFGESGTFKFRRTVLSQINSQVFGLKSMSGLSGEATHQKLVKLSEMLEWNFYDTNEDMKDASNGSTGF